MASLVPRLHPPAFNRKVEKSRQGAWYISSRDIRQRRDVGCVVWCVVLLIRLRVTCIVALVFDNGECNSDQASRAWARVYTTAKIQWSI